MFHNLPKNYFLHWKVNGFQHNVGLTFSPKATLFILWKYLRVKATFLVHEKFPHYYQNVPKVKLNKFTTYILTHLYLMLWAERFKSHHFHLPFHHHFFNWKNWAYPGTQNSDLRVTKSMLWFKWCQSFLAAKYNNFRSFLERKFAVLSWEIIMFNYIFFYLSQRFQAQRWALNDSSILSIHQKELLQSKFSDC